MKINHGFDQISSCADCRVKAADLFETNLSDKSRAAFDRMAVTRTCGAGERLFAEGSEPRGVFLVDHGRVKLVRHADDHPQVVKIAHAGDVLGLGATLTRVEHRVTAEALCETTVRFLPAQEFDAFLKHHPAYIGHLVTYIEQHAHREAVPFVMNAAARKVASFVLESARRDGRKTGEGVAIDLPVTIKELSSVIYVPAERIEDVFERFEDRHWLYRGHRSVTLLDGPALESISHGVAVGQA